MGRDLLEKLISVFPIINNVATNYSDMVDNALDSILIALNKTLMYQRMYREEQTRIPDLEAQLSHYWKAAAIPMRHIDGELSELCEYKSEYWADPDIWENIDDVDISLASVRNKFRNRLARHRRNPT